MPTGFAPYTPTPRFAALIDAVATMLAPGGALHDVRPVTVRQVYYRLIATVGFDKTERAFQNLIVHLARARRAEILSFADFVDNGITERRLRHDDGPEDQIAYAKAVLNGDGYRLDRQRDQVERLHVWSETAGMVPQLASVCAEYGVDVISGGGQPSISVNHATAERIAEQAEAGSKAIATVLSLSDDGRDPHHAE